MQLQRQFRAVEANHYEYRGYGRWCDSNYGCSSKVGWREDIALNLNLITIRSNVFTVYITAQVTDEGETSVFAEKRILAIVDRSVDPIRVRYSGGLWNETNRYLTRKPARTDWSAGHGARSTMEWFPPNNGGQERIWEFERLKNFWINNNIYFTSTSYHQYF
jgi:hypothetical protein